jgi:predicted methyltransferase
VRRALAPRGRLFLFYEPPSAERARQAVERVTARLRAEGFKGPEVLAPTPTLVCCVSGVRR